jgi:uncharacterized Zn-finger protein
MFQCNVCAKKFKTKAHVKYHEFCLNGTKPFKCETCGQGFVAKSHFEYHLRTHTGKLQLMRNTTRRSGVFSDIFETMPCVYGT